MRLYFYEKVKSSSCELVDDGYIESSPTAKDPNFHIYYGEVHTDHEVRLVSFLVNSHTGAITIDDLVDPQPIDYSSWKNTCTLEACQK